MEREGPEMDNQCCIANPKKFGANVELNVEHNENGRLIGARHLLILKVGTAGFEPTASCTPKNKSTL